MDELTKTTLEKLDSPEKRRVLILGGGFGGIKAALELAGTFKFEVTLISDQLNFRYYPMLYRSATGGSKVASSIPLNEIFADKKLEVAQDTAVELDRGKKAVKGQSGKFYPYDILIVALGSVTNFFGIKGLEQYAYGIKSLEEAQRLRDHLHKQLQDDQRPDINYVVIGGGATGVELAGVLPGYVKHIMKRHKTPAREVSVALVEAEPRLLPRMSEKYSAAVAKRLESLGVKLYLKERVLAETADSLKISGRSMQSETVVWTAGVTTNPFLAGNGFKLNEHGKTVVDEYLQAEPDIYVIGDNAATEYSGMAQTALRDGLFVAKPQKAYQPKRPIYVIAVGNFWAAVSWGQRDFFGPIGWLLRRAADLAGYHDLEPWWKASRHWMAENDTEEDCPICSKK
jgi:NADH dehydrogenase